MLKYVEKIKGAADTIGDFICAWQKGFCGKSYNKFWNILNFHEFQNFLFFIPSYNSVTQVTFIILIAM